MSATIPVLWSDDISVDVVSPLAILRAQTGPLSRMTKGLLEAEIETITSDSGKVQHQFDLIAPVLNNFRRRILIATHQRDLVYPVVVEAEFSLPDDRPPNLSAVAGTRPRPTDLPLDGRRPAATVQEFIKLVGEVLRSPQIRSLIQSLIARSNDLRKTSDSSSSVNKRVSE
jgi:hypothetical protein